MVMRGRDIWGEYYSAHDNIRRQRQDKHDRWKRHKEGVERSRSGGSYFETGGGQDGSPEAPTMGPAPVLEMPEYDEDKVSALTQKRAAPGVRRLRETTRQAMGATYDNPNVKRMTVRDALAGYGTGLEGVVAGAGRAASAEYGQQYAASVNASMARFRGALDRQSQEYSTRSHDWLMGREKHWEDEYEDPYDAFDKFYGEGQYARAAGSKGGGGETRLSSLQKSRPQRDQEWNERPFSRAR